MDEVKVVKVTNSEVIARLERLVKSQKDFKEYVVENM